MASLLSTAAEYAGAAVRRMVTTIAWLLADWMGWRAGVAVYPPMLRGKVAIVTGANSGLGLETTKALLQQGATVIMACRSLEKGSTARADILRDPRNHGEVSDAEGRLKLMRIDVEDFHTIRQFVDDFHKLGLPLHVLVNNAGVHLMPYKQVDCGFERNIAANYFGPFYLTHLLLDDLKASAPARVVNVASVGEAMGLLYMRSVPWDDLRGRNLPDSGERAYALSKSYLLMANTRELARRLEGTGVDVIAVHPGVTDSSWYLKADTQSYTFSWVIHRVRSVAPFIGVGQPTGAGAISSIYASIEPSLRGISSSPTSHGIIDALSRRLFGGRLAYYGPAYLFHLLAGPINFFNTRRCWPVNPWVYNQAACKRLYEMSLDMVAEVEREIGQAGASSAQQGKESEAAAVNGGTSNDITEPTSGVSASVLYEGGLHHDGALKQRQQAAAASAAPAGAGDTLMMMSGEALPARGS